MANDPLLTVLSLAKEAEETAALELREAHSKVQQCEAQLQALNRYRLEYMQQLKDKASTQVSIVFFQQFHKFIKQIDDAIEQQLHAKAQVKDIHARKQSQWMQQQQKRKAVEQLLDKTAKAVELKAVRQEQKLNDEFAMQQFYRRQAK